jgi:hypothetical protein
MTGTEKHTTEREKVAEFGGPTRPLFDIFGLSDDSSKLICWSDRHFAERRNVIKNGPGVPGHSLRFGGSTTRAV